MTDNIIESEMMTENDTDKPGYFDVVQIDENTIQISIGAPPRPGDFDDVTFVPFGPNTKDK